MTQIYNPNLRRYLQIANAGPAEAKRLVASIPRELSAYAPDGSVTSVRELLTTSAIQGTNLIQTEFVNTIMDGAKTEVCFRQAGKVLPMSTNTLRVPVRTGAAYAPEVAEGEEVPLRSASYAYVDITAKKYGERPLVSTELLEDSMYPILEDELRESGIDIEKTLNQVALTAWLDGSGLEVDTAGTNQGRIAVSTAVTKLVKAGYSPDTIVMSPEFEGKIREEILLPSTANNVLAEETYRSGKIASNLMGLDWYSCNVADASSTYTWGYANNDEIGAIVYDSNRYARIGMKRPITVTRFADPIRDMQSATVTSRFGVKVVTANTNAACRIKF